MKPIYFLPLLLLSACSTPPKLALRPQQPSATAADTIRYPEVIRAYHFGRYVDPNNDLVMHEQHVVFRVEENSRWDLQPLRAATIGSVPVSDSTTIASRNAAFSPLPVNDAVLAEVNAQKLTTVQILTQAQTLSASLGQFQSALQQTRTNLQETAAMRATIGDMKHRLDALENAAAQTAGSSISTTNEPTDSLSP
jgi:hypothetical protein